MNAKFDNRGAYLSQTQLQSVLRNDAVFQVNIRGLSSHPTHPEEFKQVRSWLVKSAVARYRRSQAVIHHHEQQGSNLERELIAA